MPSNKLVLKDGTEFPNGSASRLNNTQLMVRIPGNKIVEAASIFTDPKKTEVIVCYASVYKYTFTGYTEMYLVQYFADEDYTELWLKAPKDGETSMSKELTVPKEYMPFEGGESNA